MKYFTNFSLCLLQLLLLSSISHIGAHPGHGEEDMPMVDTKTGHAKGGIKFSRDGRMYFEFLGIPYGKVNKRFEDAVPPEPWKHKREFKKPGPICYQKTFHTQEVVGKENCLNLNVYTTTFPSVRTKIMPVMVFIHGGGFQSGSGIMYTPNFLIEENVVVVTVNYRLGPFGWLNLGTKEAAGNQGAKDVVLALEWIYNNIKAFNGDKTRVTIVGQSAGGGLVTSLLLSPMAQGLFHNAIIMSGAGTTPLFLNKRPKHYAMQIASKLNCDTASEDPQKVVACLQKVDKLDLLNVVNQLNPDWDNEDLYGEFAFGLSVEDEIDDVEAFLPRSPAELLAEGDFIKIPVFLGVTEMETLHWAGAPLRDEKKLAALNTDWNRVAPLWLYYYGYGQTSAQYDMSNTAERDDLSTKIKKLYFQDVVKFKNDESTALKMENALSDSVFTAPTRQLALHLARQSNPSYLYMFSKRMSGKETAPPHAEELNYLFSVSPPDGIDPPIGKESPDYKFSKHMTKLWASFAYEGKPTHVWGKGAKDWKAVSSTEKKKVTWYKIHDDGIDEYVEDAAFSKRMEFWETTWENEAKSEGGSQQKRVEL